MHRWQGRDPQAGLQLGHAGPGLLERGAGLVFSGRRYKPLGQQLALALPGGQRERGSGLRLNELRARHGQLVVAPPFRCVSQLRLGSLQAGSASSRVANSDRASSANSASPRTT